MMNAWESDPHNTAGPRFFNLHLRNGEFYVPFKLVWSIMTENILLQNSKDDQKGMLEYRNLRFLNRKYFKIIQRKNMKDHI